MSLISESPAREVRLRRALIEAGLLLVVGLAYTRWHLSLWNGFVDYDGHFHLMVAYWIAEHGAWTDLPWLPFTVLGPNGPDHQWLWHLLLVPFTSMADPGQALAWATSLNAAVTLGATAFVMRMLGVPAAPLFAVLAMTAGTLMPWRLMMLRTQNIALIFMLVCVWAMARGRYRWLALVAFLFIESYHAALILLPMALLGTALQSMERRALVVDPLLAVAGGLGLGLLVSPWFPTNIDYLLFHTLYKTTLPLLSDQLSALVGSEWYRPGWRGLATQCWPAHVMLVGAIAAVGHQRTRGQAPRLDTLLAIGTALLTLGLYSGAIRFAEYYVPFAALSAGLAARDWRPALRVRWQFAALVAWTLLSASVGLAATARVPVLPRDYLAAVGERLNTLGRSGDVVFNSAWSDFMPLVWRASAFRYVNGLDGHFLPYADPARFVAWVAVSQGSVDDPVNVMRRAFGARFAVVSRQHERLAGQLLRSPQAVLQARSPEGWLFELRRPGTTGPDKALGR